MFAQRSDRERLLETLETRGWRLVLEGLLLQMRAWSVRLLEDPTLDETERRGLVYARNAQKEGIEHFYKQAGVTLPTWIVEEFDYYHARD